MSEKREAGYYWVTREGVTEVAELYFSKTHNTYRWFIVGDDATHSDDFFDEIGHRITPEQKYTEEDMTNFGYEVNMTRGKSVLSIFEDWTEQKQRKEDSK